MRPFIDILNEGFFSGDEDCWIDANGETHDLDRQSRETHRMLAKKLLADQIPPNDDEVKFACAKGWVRIWVEGTICFVALDYKHVSRKAIVATTSFLKKTISIFKIWIEDSASPDYEEFTDIKRACGKLQQLSIKHDLAMMFETDQIDEVYSRENGYVKQHLGNTEFDGYRYWNYAYTWAQQSEEQEEIEEILGDVPQEDEPEQFEKLTPALKKSFEEWVTDYLNHHAPEELPSSQYFDSSPVMIPRNTWLVHFSNDAEEIIEQGFTHGTYDLEELGLTTYRSKESKRHGGYNFAFIAQSRDAILAAQKKKYGSDCVVFQNSGVKTYHYSDEEDQVIFWGPEVDRRHMALIVQRDGDFQVKSRTGMILFSGAFDAAVQWVITNHRQYSNQLYGSR